MRRLSVALLAAALLAACGGGDGGAQSEAPRSCKAVVGEFVEKLDDLDARVELNITFTDYAGALNELDTAAADLTGPSPQVDARCREDVLDPALEALEAFTSAEDAWKACGQQCTAAEYDKLSELWAEASIALRGLDEELGVASPAVASKEVCQQVLAARDLVEALKSGDLIEGDAIAQAQDLQNEFVALKADARSSGDDALEDEITSIIVALSDVALAHRLEEAADGLDLALDDVDCPDATREPTPIV